MREALRVANMDEMSLKVIRKQLEVKWQVNSKYQQKHIICSWSRARSRSVPHSSQLCTSAPARTYTALCSLLIQQYSLWVQDTIRTEKTSTKKKKQAEIYRKVINPHTVDTGVDVERALSQLLLIIRNSGYDAYEDDMMEAASLFGVQVLDSSRTPVRWCLYQRQYVSPISPCWTLPPGIISLKLYDTYDTSASSRLVFLLHSAMTATAAGMESPRSRCPLPAHLRTLPRALPGIYPLFFCVCHLRRMEHAYGQSKERRRRAHSPQEFAFETINCCCNSIDYYIPGTTAVYGCLLSGMRVA